MSYNEIKENLEEELQYYSDLKELTTSHLKEFCQNKEYPIEDRWNIFITSDLGVHENWEEFDEGGYEKEDYDEIIINLKEEILQMFIKSFTYDW